MNEVELLKKYQYLSKVYNYESFTCDQDEIHGDLFINVDEKFDVYLFCLFCNYRYYPGIVKLEQVASFLSSLPE